jgi:Putative zinc-finger
VRFLVFRRHPVRESDLSAYLDGRLSERRQTRVETHLESCAGCRRTLEEMRQLVAELRSLPASKAPRSFALSPELAAVTRRAETAAVEKEGTAVRRAYLGFGGAAAAAALLLVVLFGAGLLAGGGGGGPDSTTASSARVSSGAALPAPAVAAPTDAVAKRLDTETDDFGGTAATPSSAEANAPGEQGAEIPANPPAATVSPSGEAAAATEQAAQPAEKRSEHIWLWIVEGAAGGLVIGFGSSAFWMRRRWIQIDRDQ